jgi:endonuclease-3
MKTAARTRAILAKLEAQHPAAQTELRFDGPYQLLVATILSAQTTDERVNQVTPDLFARCPDAHALASADIGEVERLIHSTGFYAQKARSLVSMARRIVERHGGRIPSEMEALVQLPGVGRKTANVVLGHALGVPGLAVDRHVLRVSNRIGIAASEDPEVVERQLTAALPRAEWTLASDTLILHGRRVCKPHPLCDRCAVRRECEFYRGGAAASAAPPQRHREAAAGARSRPGAAKKAAANKRPTTRRTDGDGGRAGGGSRPAARRKR